MILSSYAEPDFAFSLLESGLEGRAYILKERVSDRGQLVSAIHTVAAGGSVMDPKVVEPLMLARAREKRSVLEELTPASSRCSARSHRARATPRSPSRSS